MYKGSTKSVTNTEGIQHLPIEGGAGRVNGAWTGLPVYHEKYKDPPHLVDYYRHHPF